MDLGEYLFHRAQHAIPFLWAMHSLHHSDTALNVTSAQRHFWLEPAMKSVTIWLLVSLLFRADTLIFTTYFLASLANLLFHSNLRLGVGRASWLINTPQYHRLHHSIEPEHNGVNYAAILPIFDVLTGAYRRPRAGEYPATGLPERSARPHELLVWPARDALRRVEITAGP
jgi:sterol desaturase/sphingolipid hydroxylase (fatty acid hydroxylase superfamily)